MCGSADRSMLGLRLNTSQGSRPRRVSGIAVSVKKCRDCELVYADPMPVPQSLADHYEVEPEAYFPDRLAPEPVTFDPQLTEVLPLTPGMKALDIGAGVGRTMQALSKLGWDTWGIEPSRSFAKVAVERMGVPRDRIIVAPMETARVEEASFDLVTIAAVLEHLYSPPDALVRALSWVKPGGILHVEVPSSRHLLGRLLNLYNRLWGLNYVTNLSPMHPPYHLFEFSHRSFEEHAKTAGYEIAAYRYWVGDIFNMPRFAHGPLRSLMKWRGTGMQLTIWLKKPN
jgi:2-polyprenyl-3-methyl-5-hydroxy-6-metoxy-1,4-benzoquinol methylase